MIDFLCPGAEKTGTSFIYSILRCHPAVYMPQKDTSTLISSGFDQERWQEIDFHDYAGQPKIGVFQVDWLQNPDVPAWLAQNTDRAALRIILCVRHPVLRALSEYKMRVRDLVESMDFADALAGEEARRAADPQRQHYFAYAGHSRYAAQARSYLKHFDPSQILVVRFEDDLIADIHETLWRIFQFIGLGDEDARITAMHPMEDYRISAIEQSRAPTRFLFDLQRPGGGVERIEHPDAEALRVAERVTVTSDNDHQFTPRIFLNDGTTVRQVRTDGAVIGEHSADEIAGKLANLSRRHETALADEVVDTLFQQYFAEDVAETEALFGCDLSSWRPGGGTGSIG